MFKATQASLNTAARYQQLQTANNSIASEEVFFMAWTTTPWTLPSNLGLTVGPNIDYVLVKTVNPYTLLPVNVILAKALMGKYFKAEGENALKASMKKPKYCHGWY